MSSIKKQSMLVKIILVLLFDIYGLIRRLESKSLLIKILGLVFFFTGSLCGLIFLIDLITVIVQKDVTVLA